MLVDAIAACVNLSNSSHKTSSASLILPLTSALKSGKSSLNLGLGATGTGAVSFIASVVTSGSSCASHSIGVLISSGVSSVKGRLKAGSLLSVWLVWSDGISSAIASKDADQGWIGCGFSSKRSLAEAFWGLYCNCAPTGALPISAASSVWAGTSKHLSKAAFNCRE